ncbi:hypothetical protein [Ehrlichia japonica]|uniref:Uncharacterized protein n=1 Tax=Ehrlichia japonica TaxID=391036 RepID=X5GJ59_9RICK|nr:hypothetical protein [Ehrlichia japonica]AHX04196.1 hypothetical protein EHF_0904 [Ehrlichia japonica]
MLLDKEFSNVDKIFNCYFKLSQHNKLRSKHNIFLGIGIYVAMLVNLMSIVVLYHHSEFFLPIFKGKYKLFSANVPVFFSIALIIVIPSFILLCFLIYKMRTAQNITEQITDELDDLMSSAKRICGLLKYELDANKESVNAVMRNYEYLENKQAALADKYSVNFNELNAECSRLEELLSQTTATASNKIKVMQDTVGDIKEKLTQLSVYHNSARETETQLYDCILRILKAEGATLEKKIQFLQELRIDLSTPAISTDSLKCDVCVIIADIKKKVPKPKIAASFLPWNNNSLYDCMWRFHDYLSMLSSKIDKWQTDTCNTGSIVDAIKALEDFCRDFKEKMELCRGSNLQQLKAIGFVQVPSLQIRMLRFLLGKRSTVLTDVCRSLQDFAVQGIGDLGNRGEDDKGDDFCILGDDSTASSDVLRMEDIVVSGSTHSLHHS